MSQSNIAILDDYQRVAFEFADWSAVRERAAVTVFPDHLADVAALVERLLPFNAICVMRERTPLTRQILAQLPNLKLIVSTGKRNASIDTAASADLGIKVANTGYHETGAPELTWALLLAIARQIVPENAAVRRGGWQEQVGTDLSGKTIGIVGLGRIGSTIASYARAFNMEVGWVREIDRRFSRWHDFSTYALNTIMKKALLSVIIIAFCAISLRCVAQADSTGKGKVGTAINKAGNKTAQVAVSGASAVKDKKFASKVGPQGQTIYINKNDHYYYVNGRGKKVYVSKLKLKNP